MQKKRLWQQRRAREGFRGEVPKRRSYYAQAPARHSEHWLERSILAGALLASIGLHVALSEVPPPPRKAPVLVPRQPVILSMPIIEEEIKLEPPPEPTPDTYSKNIGSGAAVESKQATPEGKSDNRRRMDDDRNVASSSGALAALEGNRAVENAFNAENLAQELDDLKEGMVVANNLNRGRMGLGLQNAGVPGSGDTIGIGPLGTKGPRGKGGYNPIGDGNIGRKIIRIVDIGKPEIDGNPIYDRAAIARAINKRISSIRYCYQQQLNRNPGLYGKVTVQFTINGDGLVSIALVKATTLKNVEVESCVVNIVRRITFPEPKGGGVVQVSYPFLFSSAGKSGMN